MKDCATPPKQPPTNTGRRFRERAAPLEDDDAEVSLAPEPSARERAHRSPAP